MSELLEIKKDKRSIGLFGRTIKSTRAILSFSYEDLSFLCVELPQDDEETKYLWEIREKLGKEILEHEHT